MRRPQLCVSRASHDSRADSPRIGHDERRAHPSVNTDRETPVKQAAFPDQLEQRFKIRWRNAVFNKRQRVVEVGVVIQSRLVD
jgi:hypothetical protein